MSPALAVCPCTIATASILSLIVGRLFARRLKQRGRVRSAGRVVAATLVVGNLLAIGLLYLLLRSHTGFGLTAEEARVPLLELPKGATDVNYWWSPHWGTRLLADFRIPEDAFLEWARGHGWQPERFDASEPGSGRHTGTIRTAKGMVTGPPEQVTVFKGYYLDTYQLPPSWSHDMGWTVIYDLDTKRVYLQFTAY